MYRKKSWNFKFRNGPVPFTGKLRGFGDWWRFPKTTQENNENYNASVDEELKIYNIKIRPKRINLPTQWDDKIRCVQKSWKVHRKTQWR